MTTKPDNPLGRKAYGSIPHLIGSKRGDGDHGVNEWQHRICTEKSRPGDVVIVQEKVDGSNVAVAKIDGTIVPLVRAGYRAETSPYELHHLFADWVGAKFSRFDDLLDEGERLCGEWLAQAHGTLYDIPADGDPFVAFDIMRGSERVPHIKFLERIGRKFKTPSWLWVGPPCSIEHALKCLDIVCIEAEGVVYRVERNGKFDFIAKYVRPEFETGKYLTFISGGEAVWNWRP